MAVRSFFRWLARQRHIAYNPASELELPRTEHRLPQHVLTAPEAEQVINQADGKRRTARWSGATLDPGA